MSKNVFSLYLASPKDSPEHRRFREGLWLIGPDHACRYYLSIITEHDFFAATDEEFLDGVRAYIAKHASTKAAKFCAGPYALQFVLPFLKQQFEIAEGHPNVSRFSKQNRAMILWLRHPSWTDEQFRAALGTTEGQMRRWTTFNAARIIQRRHSR